MKVVVFGASGGIGKWAVKHSLMKGYEVVAYVRNPKKIKLKDQLLKVVKGEISDLTAMAEAMKGADAAIWCVGINLNDKLVGNDEIIGVENLLKAMKTTGVKRIIAWATTSVKAEDDKLSLLTFLPPILARFKYPNGKRELNAIANLLKRSDTDWTIVRFLGPTDKPYTGKVKVSFGDRGIKWFISREDIGSFMVNQIEDKQYVHRMPIIGL